MFTVRDEPKGDCTMAITVRDIRSKQFTSQRNWYNKDEVDDFLD